MKIIISILFLSTIGLSLGFYNAGLTTGENRNSEKMHELETQLKNIKQSKEYKAIQYCKESDYWKAECIAFELNNKK